MAERWAVPRGGRVRGFGGTEAFGHRHWGTGIGGQSIAGIVAVLCGIAVFHPLRWGSMLGEIYEGIGQR